MSKRGVSNAIVTGLVALVILLALVSAFQEMQVLSLSKSQSGSSFPYPSTLTYNASILQLSAKASTPYVNPEHSVTIYADLYNPTNSGVQVTADMDGGYAGFIFGGCSGHLLGSLAIYSGYYTSDNISGASPLPPWPLNQVSNCPTFFGPTHVIFTFYPLSDVAAVSQGNPAQLQSIYQFEAFTGYSNVTSNGPVFQPFQLGVYTVLVRDIWGHQALCYFYVTTAVSPTVG